MVENSYKTRLIEYFKRNLKKGYPVDTLRIALVNQGYSRPAVDDAAKEAIRQMATAAPIIKEKPQIECQVLLGDEPIEQKPSFWKKIIDFFKG